MGYTHYYTQRRKMSVGEFEEFKKDVVALAAALPPNMGEFERRFGEASDGGQGGRPLAIANDDPGEPIMGEDWVSFNGAGYEDAEHETFSLLRDGGDWGFTKTARKPYDAMVCACLLAAESRAPGAWKIGSDGGVDEWAAAARFAQHVLGRELPLASVSSFGQSPEEVERALAPTPWMLAQSEAAAVARASARPGLAPGAPKAL